MASEDHGDRAERLVEDFEEGRRQVEVGGADQEPALFLRPIGMVLDKLAFPSLPALMQSEEGDDKPGHGITPSPVTVTGRYRTRDRPGSCRADSETNPRALTREATMKGPTRNSPPG